MKYIRFSNDQVEAGTDLVDFITDCGSIVVDFVKPLWVAITLLISYNYQHNNMAALLLCYWRSSRESSLFSRCF